MADFVAFDYGYCIRPASNCAAHSRHANARLSVPCTTQHVCIEAKHVHNCWEGDTYLPSLTAATIVAKLSSASTIFAASLLTSVPVIPIATPMSAACGSKCWRDKGKFLATHTTLSHNVTCKHIRQIRRHCRAHTRATANWRSVAQKNGHQQSLGRVCCKLQSHSNMPSSSADKSLLRMTGANQYTASYAALTAMLLELLPWLLQSLTLPPNCVTAAPCAMLYSIACSTWCRVHSYNLVAQSIIFRIQIRT